MAKRPTVSNYASEEDNGSDAAQPVGSSRRRIQLRSPDEMAGLTVSLLVPNAYLPHLLEAYIAGAKEGTVNRRGRKLPEAIMVRQLLIRALAELAGEEEDTVAEAMAEAEREEAASIADHKARYGV